MLLSRYRNTMGHAVTITDFCGTPTAAFLASRVGTTAVRDLSASQTQRVQPRDPSIVVPLAMPTTFSRPKVLQPDGASVTIKMAGVGRIVRDMTRALHVTPTMLYLSFYGALLHRYTGQDMCMVSIPSANHTSETADIIGMFVETLMSRMDFTASYIRRLVQQVRSTVLAAMDHSAVPFETVVNRVLTRRDVSRMPLVQTMLGASDQLRTSRKSGSTADDDSDGLHMGDLMLQHFEGSDEDQIQS